MEIRLKRAFEPSEPDDGYRVLVDRLWPRGRSRAALAIDEWPRELAPSTELRRWFAHDPQRFEEFRRRYTRELRAHQGLLDELRGRARRERLTLVFGARDERHNNARVIEELLRRGFPEGPASDR